MFFASFLKKKQFLFSQAEGGSGSSPARPFVERVIDASPLRSTKIALSWMDIP
jgi:hypothetical protein